jgi:hypothetical protein
MATSMALPESAATGPKGSKTLSRPEAIKVKPPSSSFAPPSGPVGTAVTINGTGLTQTTRVAFDGTAASFPVN